MDNNEKNEIKEVREAIERKKSGFSNLNRVIAIVVLLAIAISIFAISFAYEEDEVYLEPEQVIVQTPVPEYEEYYDYCEDELSYMGNNNVENIEYVESFTYTEEENEKGDEESVTENLENILEIEEYSEEVFFEIEPMNTSYDVYFWDTPSFGGRLIRTIRVNGQTSIIAPAGVTHPGFVFLGWYGVGPQMYSAGQSMPVSPVNCGFTAYYLTSRRVRFIDWDGRTIENKNVTTRFEYNKYSNYSHISPLFINYPGKPLRQGYLFSGWMYECCSYTGQWRATCCYKVLSPWANADSNDPFVRQDLTMYGGGSCYVGNRYVLDVFDHRFGGDTECIDIVMRATYVKNNTLTVTYQGNGGHFDGVTSRTSTTRTVNHGTIAPDISNTLTRTGHTFTGWSPSLSAVTGNVTYTANWSPIQHTVRFHTCQGVFIDQRIVNQGANVTNAPAYSHTGHTFLGWNQSINNIQSNINVNAQCSLIAHTVTYQGNGGHFDGVPSRTTTTRQVNHGTVAPDISNTLTRAGHVFIGWSPSLNAVTGNVTYTANWSIADYTITYNANGGFFDGVALRATTIRIASWGQIPQDIRNTVTREGHTFSHWSPSLTPVNGNTTYTANWIPDSYNITFRDWDDRQVSSNTVDFGTNVNSPAAQTRVGRTFLNWRSECGVTVGANQVVNVKRDMVFIAQYSAELTFWVEFRTWDGSIISTQNVSWGGNAILPMNPTREGFTFVAWDKSNINIMADTTITATFRRNVHTVIIKDWDGRQIFSEETEWANNVIMPKEQVREGHTFTNFKSECGIEANARQAVNVRKNLVFTVQYEIRKVTVEFKNWNGEAIGEPQTVNWGENVALPLNPAREGHTFVAWDKSNINIKEDTVITATFRINSHTVIFLEDENADVRDLSVMMVQPQSGVGNIIDVDWGSYITMPEGNPKKGFTFIIWKSECGIEAKPGDSINIKNDMVFVAQYSKNKHDFIFVNHDNSEFARIPAYFGDTIQPPGTNPVREGHIFDGWDRHPIIMVEDENTIVRPRWIIQTFEVVFLNWNGSELSKQTIEFGGTAIAPQNPSRSGFTFTGWSRALTNIRENTIINAQFTSNPVTQPPVNQTPNPQPQPSPTVQQPAQPPRVNPTPMPAVRPPVIEMVERQPGNSIFPRFSRVVNIPQIEEISDDNPLPLVAEMPPIRQFMGVAVEDPDVPIFRFMGRDVYFFAPISLSSWSLINLILCAVGALLAAKTILPVINKRKEEEDEDHLLIEDEDEELEKAEKQKWLIGGISVSILAVVLFAVTQDLTGLVALFDMWTIAHVALVIAQVVLFKLYSANHKEEIYSDFDDEDDLEDFVI